MFNGDNKNKKFELQNKHHSIIDNTQSATIIYAKYVINFQTIDFKELLLGKYISQWLLW